MRVIILAAAAGVLGACMPAQAMEVKIRLSYTDLRLDSREGRAHLRSRVAEAAQSYCAAHHAEVTPHDSRADPYYCPDMLRSWIVHEMSPATRRAYALARREAGVRGRRL
ncbi:UrcA family protein [Sphingomonas sp. JC676]|uniref:UrcA family protein n=1 Tax=Sphingomonas sp. JC676 TaxID=2768065 RepID=UPI0016586C37|nr:UrcA family protein [Sphingomonas sp. JC676]MBC9033180.1 UrcA family protein [Sphingomonas sp. JC676]